jgi:hypothetical protein
MSRAYEGGIGDATRPDWRPQAKRSRELLDGLFARRRFDALHHRNHNGRYRSSKTSNRNAQQSLAGTNGKADSRILHLANLEAP